MTKNICMSVNTQMVYNILVNLDIKHSGGHVSTASIVTRPQWTGQLTIVVLFPAGIKEIFSPSKDLVWLWDLPSTLFNKYQGLFSWEKSSQGVKPTTQLHPVRGLRMSGTVPPTSPYAFMACTGFVFYNKMLRFTSHTQNT